MALRLGERARLAGEEGKGAEQEGLELRGGHFSRRHREFPVAVCAESGRVTVEGNVVRRIREDDVGLLVVHQNGVCRRIECAAADNAMTTEDPQVSDLADGPTSG